MAALCWWFPAGTVLRQVCPGGQQFYAARASSVAFEFRDLDVAALLVVEHRHDDGVVAAAVRLAPLLD